MELSLFVVGQLVEKLELVPLARQALLSLKQLPLIGAPLFSEVLQSHGAFLPEEEELVQHEVLQRTEALLAVA